MVCALEFPGCITTGDTQQEALEMLDDAMTSWLRTRLEDGDTIPDPLGADDFSGRFVVRVTKSLHRDLVRAAERNGVSLNLFVATTLALAAGAQTTSATAQPAISYLNVPPRSRRSKRKKA